MSAPSPLPYDLVFEERPGYLLARVSGAEDSLQTSLHFWQAIVEEARRRQVTRLMVVEDFPNDIPTLEMLRVVNFLVGLGMRQLRTAFVDLRNEHLARNLLGEVVITARGIPGKVFASIPEAERWLLQKTLDR